MFGWFKAKKAAMLPPSTMGVQAQFVHQQLVAALAQVHDEDNAAGRTTDEDEFFRVLLTDEFVMYAFAYGEITSQFITEDDRARRLLIEKFLTEVMSADFAQHVIARYIDLGYPNLTDECSLAYFTGLSEASSAIERKATTLPWLTAYIRDGMNAGGIGRKAKRDFYNQLHARRKSA